MLVIVLVVTWIVIKLILGAAGGLIHLLLVAAVLVALYNLLRAGASRRT